MRAAQAVAEIIRAETMVLHVETGEQRDLEPLTMPAPTGQGGAHDLAAGDPGAARVVAIQSAIQEQLEHRAVLARPLMRINEATVHEDAVAPDIGAAEKEEMRGMRGVAASSDCGGLVALALGRFRIGAAGLGQRRVNAAGSDPRSQNRTHNHAAHDSVPVALRQFLLGLTTYGNEWPSSAATLACKLRMGEKAPPRYTMRSVTAGKPMTTNTLDDTARRRSIGFLNWAHFLD